MKIVVLGATGLVGGVMLKVLEERGYGQCDVIAAASPKSVGRKIPFAGRELTVVSAEDAVKAKADFAIFSAGAEASRHYAPLFAAEGTTVIDNSSAWRKDADKPLVVPEINIDAIKENDLIIANPNCSTIQMVLALSGLHARYGLKRLVVSTYQSITGTGIKAVRQLREEEQYHADLVRSIGSAEVPSQLDQMGPHSQAYPYQIFRNLFPHGGDFRHDGYTTEEQKLVDETRKILRAPEIAITATVARVPVVGGHSEAVNAEFHNEFDNGEVRQIIADTEGVVLCDEPAENLYPMPIMSEGRDEVFVGRVRRDLSQPRTLNMWVVADNLRKGAATNAVQIMQKLIKAGRRICCMILLATIGLMAGACGKSTPIDETHLFKNNCWMRFEPETYSFNVNSIDKGYNVCLTLCYDTTRFKMDRLPLVVAFYTDSNAQHNITPVFRLRDKNGKLLGDVVGNYCTVTDTIDRYRYYSQEGDYTYKIKQATSKYELHGLSSLAMKVERCKQ